VDLITKEMVDLAIETSLDTLAKFVDVDDKEYFWLKFNKIPALFKSYKSKTHAEALTLKKEVEKVNEKKEKKYE
jgi:hypothetical protein